MLAQHLNLHPSCQNLDSLKLMLQLHQLLQKRCLVATGSRVGCRLLLLDGKRWTPLLQPLIARKHSAQQPTRSNHYIVWYNKMEAPWSLQSQILHLHSEAPHHFPRQKHKKRRPFATRDLIQFTWPSFWEIPSTDFIKWCQVQWIQWVQCSTFCAAIFCCCFCCFP